MQKPFILRDNDAGVSLEALNKLLAQWTIVMTCPMPSAASLSSSPNTDTEDKVYPTCLVILSNSGHIQDDGKYSE